MKEEIARLKLRNQELEKKQEEFEMLTKMNIENDKLEKSNKVSYFIL